MRKKALTLLMAIVTTSTFVSCNLPTLPKYTTDEKTAVENANIDEEKGSDNDVNTDEEKKEEPVEALSKEDIEALSDPSKEELGWDGEWVGAGVNVTIYGADSEYVDVEFNDEEMHNASLDEASLSGNTITGVYRITSSMYAETDDVDNLPEQEWFITLVKVDGTIYYSRETVLTWYNENPDGTFGHQVTKENTAVLKKVNVTEN